jgi:hypothetical protein
MIEVSPHVIDRLRLQRELTLAPDADVADDAGALEHPEVLRYCLSGETGAFGETRDRDGRRYWKDEYCQRKNGFPSKRPTVIS